METIIYCNEVRDLSDKSNLFGRVVNSFKSFNKHQKGDFVKDAEGRMKEVQSITNGNVCVSRGKRFVSINLFINGKLSFE